MAKTKRFWSIECLTCETTLDLKASDFSIISTDQGAEFIRKPTFVCGKCGNKCYIKLVSRETDVIMQEGA